MKEPYDVFVKPVYTKYNLTIGDDFSIAAKISKNEITLVNKNKNYQNTFKFMRSHPENIKKFALAMLEAERISETY